MDRLLRERQELLMQVIEKVSAAANQCSSTKFHSKDDSDEGSTIGGE